MTVGTHTQLRWCAMLAKLTAPMDSERAAQAFTYMLPMLPKDDAAYNKDTLEQAARRNPGDAAVPNYDRLARVFSDWRKANLPVQLRMGGSIPVAQLIAPKKQVTQEEIECVDHLVATIKREMLAKSGN